MLLHSEVEERTEIHVVGLERERAQRARLGRVAPPAARLLVAVLKVEEEAAQLFHAAGFRLPACEESRQLFERVPSCLDRLGRTVGKLAVQQPVPPEFGQLDDGNPGADLTK